MTAWFRIHDGYVARTVLATLLLAWAVLLGLDVVLVVVDEIDQIGVGRYDFLGVVTYVAWSLPRRLYTLFPTAAVIGTLMGLGQLATSSELTVMRALGLSQWRIGLSVGGLLFVVTILMVINAETLAPWAQRNGDTMRMQARTRDMLAVQYSGLWAREGETFLNAQGGQEQVEGDARWLELQHVRVFEFSTEGQLTSIAKVERAEHRQGQWQFYNVERTVFAAHALKRTHAEHEQWDSRLDAAALATNANIAWRPRYMTLRELQRGIDYRQRNQLDSREFEEHYWSHWFYPINVLTLCLAAFPFAFGSLRSGNLGRRLFIGVVFAVGFWLLQNQVVKLATVYKFDYRLAYSIPPLVMLVISWSIFRRRH